MKNIILIEKYLNNELKGDMLDNFLKRLESDPQLAEDLKILTDLNIFLKNRKQEIRQSIESEDDFFRHFIIKAKESNPVLTARISSIKANLNDKVEEHKIRWLENDLYLYDEFLDELIKRLYSYNSSGGKLNDSDKELFTNEFNSIYNTYSVICEMVEIHSLRKENNLPLTSDELAFKEKLNNVIVQIKKEKGIDYNSEILSEEEIEEYNELLEQDLQFYKSSTTSSKNSRDKYHVESATNSRAARKKIKPPIIYASLFIALCLFLLMFKLITNQKDSKSSLVMLFEEYYQPYPNVLSSRSNQDHPAFVKALNAYDSRDYKSVCELIPINKYGNSFQDQVLLIYKAIALAETDSVSDAIDLLEFLSKEDGEEINIIASWYLGLFYLKYSDCEHALQTFEYLEVYSSIYKEKCHDLIKNLNGC